MREQPRTRARAGWLRATLGLLTAAGLALTPATSLVTLAAQCMDNGGGQISLTEDEVAGNITLGGAPAPAGTRITASYNGVTVGCATVDQAGTYEINVNGRDDVHANYPAPGQQYTLAVNGDSSSVTPNSATFQAAQAPAPFAPVSLDLQVSAAGAPAGAAPTSSNGSAPSASQPASGGTSGSSSGATGSAPAVAPNSPPAGTSSGPCQYELGFKLLHDLDPADVGNCVDNESHSPTNGDGLQRTVNGLMVWRKADNWTAFTNGYWTWINGPNGLAKRLNTQRFPFEANPDGLPVVTSSAA